MGHRNSAVVALGAILLTTTAAMLSTADAVALVAANPGHSVYFCTATITYTPDEGPGELYEQEFFVAVGSPFVDDFSSPNREHRFTARASQDGETVRIDFDYFSDGSAFTWVDLDTGVSFLPGQRGESTSGRHRFFRSGCMGYTMSYTIHCTSIGSTGRR